MPWEFVAKQGKKVSTAPTVQDTEEVVKFRQDIVDTFHGECFDKMKELTKKFKHGNGVVDHSHFDSPKEPPAEYKNTDAEAAWWIVRLIYKDGPVTNEVAQKISAFMDYYCYLRNDRFQDRWTKIGDLMREFKDKGEIKLKRN